MSQISCLTQFRELGKDGYSAEDFDAFANSVTHKICGYTPEDQKKIESELNNLEIGYNRETNQGSPPGIHDDEAYRAMYKWLSQRVPCFDFYSYRRDEEARQLDKEFNNKLASNLLRATVPLIGLPTLVFTVLRSSVEKLPPNIKAPLRFTAGGLLFGGAIALIGTIVTFSKEK